MKYRAGYKYQLYEDESCQVDIHGFNIDTQFIKLTPDGVLTAKKGYAWDGASGPTIDDKTNMRAALIHDAGYQLMSEGLIPLSYRSYIDELFYDLLLKDGMPKIRAIIWYNAVRRFASDSALPENDLSIS